MSYVLIPIWAGLAVVLLIPALGIFGWLLLVAGIGAVLVADEVSI